MRIKTVPRHRLLQRNMKIAVVTNSSPDGETFLHVGKDYDSTYAIDNEDTYQISSNIKSILIQQSYVSPARTSISVRMSTNSGNELTLSSSTSTSPSLDNDDNNYVEVVNLSTKDTSNHIDETATNASAVPADKLKDTFLYKIMTDPNFLENIQRNKQPKKFVCLYCKEDFPTCEELTNHMDVKKNDSNQIACCACKKTFAEKRYLKYHQRCHSERTKFTCDICTRKYTRLDNLTRHNVLHVNPDKFSCTSCNRTFTRKDLLNKHRKSHEKYNLYCEKCGKYFRRILTLENHQKTHREMSNVSTNEIACRTDSSISAKNIVCENSASADNTTCKIENLASGQSLTCKTEKLVSNEKAC